LTHWVFRCQPFGLLEVLRASRPGPLPGTFKFVAKICVFQLNSFDFDDLYCFESCFVADCLQGICLENTSSRYEHFMVGLFYILRFFWHKSADIFEISDLFDLIWWIITIFNGYFEFTVGNHDDSLLQIKKSEISKGFRILAPQILKFNIFDLK
jgi:hypothetical protein